MSQNLQPKKSNFVSACVSTTQALLTAYNALRQLRAEWGSEGYATGGVAPIVQADIDGPSGASANSHITPTILANLMTTFDFVDSAINSGATGLAGNVAYLQHLYDMKQ